MAYVCGNDGYVEVGADTLHVTDWSATEHGDWAETTNTSSAGYKQSINCKKYLTGTITADFDVALGPKLVPIIAAGAAYAMILHTVGTGHYDLTGNVGELNWTVPVGGKISYNFTFESDGLYAYTP